MSAPYLAPLSVLKILSASSPPFQCFFTAAVASH